MIRLDRPLCVFDLEGKKFIAGKQLIETTVGRVIFNQSLPAGF